MTMKEDGSILTKTRLDGNVKRKIVNMFCVNIFKIV